MKGITAVEVVESVLVVVVLGLCLGEVGSCWYVVDRKLRDSEEPRTQSHLINLKAYDDNTRPLPAGAFPAHAKPTSFPRACLGTLRLLPPLRCKRHCYSRPRLTRLDAPRYFHWRGRIVPATRRARGLDILERTFAQVLMTRTEARRGAPQS